MNSVICFKKIRNKYIKIFISYIFLYIFLYLYLYLKQIQTIFFVNFIII